MKVKGLVPMKVKAFYPQHGTVYSSFYIADTYVDFYRIVLMFEIRHVLKKNFLN